MSGGNLCKHSKFQLYGLLIVFENTTRQDVKQNVFENQKYVINGQPKSKHNSYAINYFNKYIGTFLHIYRNTSFKQVLYILYTFT